MIYNHKEIEEKWQRIWEDEKIFQTPAKATRKNKMYILPQLPYPSGEGLHVGHAEGYTACDIYARYQRLIGKKVLQAIGWDAFGLPAENYAIKNNIHPRISTDKAIDNFRSQIKKLGISVDWDREVGSHNPDYYQWTQWFFLLFYKRGLAYRKKQAVNWCDSCKTVLANEQVTTDGKCERCSTVVEQREMEEWYLKITDYAERLLEGLDKIDWPEESKKRQRDWIGKSEGAELEFRIKNSEDFVSQGIHSLGSRDDFSQGSQENQGSQGMNSLANGNDFNSLVNRTIWFITFSTKDRQPIFQNYSQCLEIMKRLAQSGIRHDFKFHEVAVMEDHVHILLDSDKEIAVDKIYKYLKGGSAKYFNKEFDLIGNSLWTPGGNYSIIESKEKYDEVLSYIKGNPQKGKLVDSERLLSKNLDKIKLDQIIKVFTTRPDTLFGATYLVLSPEHELAREFIPWLTKPEEVEKYIDATKLKTDLDRQIEKEKTGVELQGVKAINPATGKEIPIYIADYVLSGYGTGAIMAVPAHDERDFEFAKKFNLPIKCVIDPVSIEHFAQQKIITQEGREKFVTSIVVSHDPSHETIEDGIKKFLEKVKRGEVVHVGNGKLINSGEFDGLSVEEAKKKITDKVGGKLVTRYKLRDWSVSRQRFWGAPIPMLHNQEKSKKYNYVILHGYSGTGDQNGPARGDSINWRKGLRVKLEQEGKTVYCPDLPNTEEPNIEEQVDFVLKNTGIDENTVLVSHSLGSAVIYKLLEKLNKKVAMVLLVDPVVRPDFADKQRPMVAKSCDWKFDWKKIKNLSDEFVILGDKKFGTIFEKDLKDLTERLGGDLVLAKPEEGHFTAANEPMVDTLLERVGWMTVPEKDLPVILPDDVDFKPTGESPLNYSKSFNAGVEEKYGKGWKREPDTLDTFMCSSWYYYRYLDPHNDQAFASPESLKTWMPVDFYIGGPEHVNGHLLYSRFFTKVLFDAGYIDFDEPFLKHRHQGLILGEDNRKMSKRWGNSINPTDVANEYGADTLRIYEMFMGPLEQDKPWDTNGVKGVRRFLEKVWGLQEKIGNQKSVISNPASAKATAGGQELDKLTHKTVKKVGEDIEALKFNTAVSALMILVNEMEKQEQLLITNYELLIKILSPFAPHLAEELWSNLGNHRQKGEASKKSISLESWPEYDKSLVIDEVISLVVQVNGKLRENIEVKRDITEAEAKELVLKSEKIQKYLEGKEPKKVIFVPGKLINIVI